MSWRCAPPPENCLSRFRNAVKFAFWKRALSKGPSPACLVAGHPLRSSASQGSEGPARIARRKKRPHRRETARPRVVLATSTAEKVIRTSANRQILFLVSTDYNKLLQFVTLYRADGMLALVTDSGCVTGSQSELCLASRPPYPSAIDHHRNLGVGKDFRSLATEQHRSQTAPTVRRHENEVAAL